MEILKLANKRNLLFISLYLLVLFISYVPFKELIRHSLNEELYSHIILVPFVSGYFFFLERKQIALKREYSFKAGVIVLVAGILLYLFSDGRIIWLNQNDRLSLMIFSALTFCTGGFILFYGVKAFKITLFPLLFLLFIVPIPSKAVESIISFLQIGSTETTYGFFRLIGIPVLREGFTFHLPGMSIEVARQCSGIRSSIALFITSIIAGKLFLQTGSKRVILALLIFPVAIFKNGLRIVTLSLLGTYVDPRILDSQLHKSGGIPFFFVALMLLASIVWWLMRIERKGLVCRM